MSAQPGPPPVPDPTILTTEQLLREVHGLKELMQAGLDAQEQICAEKFKSMAGQFVLVERQRVEQKEDTKAAVDAAFSAAKEAVKEQTNASDRAIAKSEGATSKQLEQLSTTFTTAIKGVTDSLSDLKDRVQAIESAKRGAKEDRTGLYATLTIGTSLAFLAIAVITLIATR